MAVKHQGGLSALPRELQAHIAMHVRGESYSSDNYSLSDLAALRLCNKRFAELGEPLLYEFRTIGPIMYNVDETTQHYNKCEKYLRAGFFTLALPPALFIDEREGASRESIEILLTDTDMATAGLIRKWGKMTSAALSCRTAQTQVSGKIRILRYTFNAICSSRNLSHIEVMSIDGHLGLSLAAELVDAMTALKSFSLSMASNGPGITAVIQSNNSFNTLAAKFRLTRAISKAANLQHLQLSGPCLSDVAEHGTFSTRLRSLAVACQDAPKAVALLIESSLNELQTLSTDVKSYAEVHNLVGQDVLTLPKVHTLDITFTNDAMQEYKGLLPIAPSLQRLGLMVIKGGTALAVQLVKADDYPALRAVKVMQRERDEHSMALADLCRERSLKLEDSYLTEEEDMPADLKKLIGLIAEDAGPEAILEALGDAGMEMANQLGLPIGG